MTDSSLSLSLFGAVSFFLLSIRHNAPNERFSLQMTISDHEHRTAGGHGYPSLSTRLWASHLHGRKLPGCPWVNTA